MPEATMQLSYALLREATKRGADMIATICPLCQFNLEGFQGRMSKRFGRPLDIPSVFVSQILGIAFGIDEERLGIKRLTRWRLPEREAAAVGVPASEGGGGDAPARWRPSLDERWPEDRRLRLPLRPEHRRKGRRGGRGRLRRHPAERRRGS
jgi:hypothetical protein